MERPLFDRLADQENARMQRATRDTDHELLLNWERLMELAQERPGTLISIARTRAPEAAARALRESKG
jgi:hypothetical protein